MNKKKLWIIVIIFALITIIDQSTKIWVKTNMLIGESSYSHWGWKMHWFQILFVENEGMAFGWTLPTEYGKLILTLIRFIVIGFVVYYIYHLLKKDAPIGLLITFAIITAGAMGNLIDSMFYGLIFSESPDIIQNLPPAKLTFTENYSTFFHGKVVDFLYFPLIKYQIPHSIPIIGGTTFSFFDPIFNIADSSITIGVIMLLVFGNRWFKKFDNNLFKKI